MRLQWLLLAAMASLLGGGYTLANQCKTWRLLPSAVARAKCYPLALWSPLWNGSYGVWVSDDIEIHTPDGAVVLPRGRVAGVSAQGDVLLIDTPSQGRMTVRLRSEFLAKDASAAIEAME